MVGINSPKFIFNLLITFEILQPTTLPASFPANNNPTALLSELTKSEPLSPGLPIFLLVYIQLVNVAINSL